uniref:leucine-rich repeat-containing protein 74A n=1 Tax=Pristiophorus japonicus TaxID=55135 RepID=UPI00398F0411
MWKSHPEVIMARHTPLMSMRSSKVTLAESIHSLCDETMDQILEKTSEDDFDTDVELEVKTIGQTLTEEQLYRMACKDVGVNPMSYYIRHHSDTHLNLNYRCMSPKALKALSIALVTNTSVTILELEHDGINAEGVQYLMEMLAENCFIQTLNLSNNELRTWGVEVLCRMLPLNISLKCINLAGNKLLNNDAAFFDEALSANFRVTELDLSYNEFGDKGAEFLGHMIANNEGLEILNLSWNQIQTQGAVALSAGLRINTNLKVLDLSYNGFGNEGAFAIGDTLKFNSTLLEINLSTNHINNEGAAMLCKGLEVNETLKILYLSNNPITVAGALYLLEVMKKNDKTSLEKISIKNVLVNESFMEQLNSIIHDRPAFQIETRGVGGFIVGSRQRQIDPMKVIQDYLDKRKLRLSDFFRNMDKARNMSVPVSDFRKVLQQLNIPLDLVQVEDLINKLDTDNTGAIDYRNLVDSRKRMIRDQREQLRKEETRQRKESHKTQRVLKTLKSAMKAITPRSSIVISAGQIKLPDIQPLESSSARRLSATPLGSWHHAVTSIGNRYWVPTLSRVQGHRPLSHSDNMPSASGVRSDVSLRQHSISQPDLVPKSPMHSLSCPNMTSNQELDPVTKSRPATLFRTVKAPPSETK